MLPKSSQKIKLQLAYQQGRCPRAKPVLCERRVRRALRLCVLCGVSLSTAGSAVGPCGSAGRTVRRCLSAASNSLRFASDQRQKRQVEPTGCITSTLRPGQLTGETEREIDRRAYSAIDITPSRSDQQLECVAVYLRC